MSFTRETAPLSPHLSIWRFSVTMAASITTRITGVGLYLGAILLTVWLAAAAIGDEAFAAVQAVYTSPLGLIILFGFTWALFYHLLAGIRHLFWDAGYGFKLPVAHGTAWGAYIGSAVLTLAVWGAAWATGAF